MLHEEEEDDGGDAEDEAGEAHHHGCDHILEPHGGGHQPRVRGRGAGAPGHVGVQLLQPVHCAHITHRQKPLESEVKRFPYLTNIRKVLFFLLHKLSAESKQTKPFQHSNQASRVNPGCSLYCPNLREMFLTV